MKFLSILPGRLMVELTSADPEAALQAISTSGISLSSIQKKTELTYLLSVPPKAYATVSAICNKQGNSLQIIEKNGLYWTIKHLKNRKFLLFGFCIFLFLSLFLPTRVFFVHVQGNQTIPSKQILAAAQDCGISFGASRKMVRSEKVKNRLLYAMPQLQWVGVNTVGSVATISVRERSEAPAPEKPAISSIIANRDGYLLSVTVNSGNPLCKPGQYVTAGQLLVSGFTDCGIYIQATPSEAEILAQTIRHFEAIRPSNSIIRVKETGRVRKYSLLIGKKRINLVKGSGILDSSCGRIYKEKYAALPGGFRLPLALCVEEFCFFDTFPVTSEEASTAAALSSFAEDYLRKHMVAGTVLSKEETFFYSDGVVCLDGTYTCQEMIGKVQKNQIGD